MMVVTPRYFNAERQYINKNFGYDVLKPVGTGVMISECHGITNMHVLFQPYDLLSVGRERERQVVVMGQRHNGERVVGQASVVMSTPSFWASNSKEGVQMLHRSFVAHYRHYNDIALFRVSPLVQKDAEGVFRKRNFGQLLGWYVPAWSPPTERIFMSAGVKGDTYYGKRLTPKLPFKAYIDEGCNASWMDEQRPGTIFRGDCSVISGMSGGPVVAKNATRKLYGLVQGANLKHLGAPPRMPELYDPEKFRKLQLNTYLAVWPHRERLLKAMKEHPCEQ